MQKTHFENVRQQLIETMADFLDSIQMDEYNAKVGDPVDRTKSKLHIRMADAAFKQYKKTVK
jgi:hypothetical protein